MNRILLLEDDINLSDTIVEFLEDHEYSVTPVYDGESAEEIIYENSFDLLLLDVNVPGITGFELLKNIRSDNSTPAIFITSLNSIDDLEEGYASGGDDYIRKPFELKELKLRVENILKRGYFHAHNPDIEINEQIKYDTSSNTLYIDGEATTLKNKEAKLLKLFMQHIDQVISHEVIYNSLWEYDETPSEASLRTYIKNLRKIIGKEKIVSFKKLGYKFTQ
jgi:DNA-binding response OmpR family regulator